MTMPEEQTAEETQGGGGAPAWMLTFGDTITLLLTFFLMLLTFSTPNPEDFQAFTRGLMGGRREMSAFPGQPGMGDLAPQQRHLDEARLDTEGAETPPMEHEDPLEVLRKYPEEIDISMLKQLKGAVVIRVALVDLFGVGTELDRSGMEILSRIVKVTRAKAYSIVVRASAAQQVPAGQRQTQSLAFAMKVVHYLRQYSSGLCKDIGLSDNIQLLDTPLLPGMCEIIMLEV